MNGNDASLTIRKRSRLPEGRVVEVTVSRLSTSRVALLVLLLGVLAFLGGVAAGTGGYYRHAVDTATRGLGDDSLLRAALLAPDRATTPSLARRLSAVEKRLLEISEGYSKERELRESLSSAFTAVAGRLGEMRDAIQGMDGSVRDAKESSDHAADALGGLLAAIEKARELATEQGQSKLEEMANDPL